MLGLTKTAQGEGNMALVEHPDPTAKPGWVVLEVAAAAICGTDLHILKGEYAMKTPVIIGHETVGRVVAVGEGVDDSWIGRRAVVVPVIGSCGACPQCQDGYPALCPDRRSIGTHVNGAFAPLLTVPATHLLDLPHGLSEDCATLCEPIACVCHGLFDPNVVAPGDSVLVVGPGPIGQMAAQVARAAGGIVTVRGVPADGDRLKAAESLGFAVEVAGDGALIPERFDTVVECSGNAHGIADALAAAKRRAPVVQLGICGGDVTIPYDLICYKQLTLSSIFAASPRSWRRAMAIVGSGAMRLEPLVTRVGPLAEWRAVFDAAIDKSGLKCVVRPN